MVRQLTCPICDKTLDAVITESSTFPFCSERCRNVDLLRWCKGEYAIVEPLTADPQTEIPRNEAELDRYLEEHGL